MLLNNIEHLKNKYNTLLSQNLKNNSFIEMSKGSSSNQGSIQDLIFDNTSNIKHSLEEDLKYSNKKPKDNDNIIENLLTLLVNPTNIMSSMKLLNNISSNSGEDHLYEVMKGVNKANKTIKKVFGSLF